MNAQSPNLSQPMFETWAAADGTVITIRPIGAADLPLEAEFVNGLSASTGYRRLMSPRRPSHEELRRFTNIDDERELALIASTLLLCKNLLRVLCGGTTHLRANTDCGRSGTPLAISSEVTRPSGKNRLREP
jgi:hypothetical protein